MPVCAHKLLMTLALYYSAVQLQERKQYTLLFYQLPVPPPPTTVRRVTLSPSDSTESPQTTVQAHFLIEISWICPLDSIPGLRTLLQSPYFPSQYRATPITSDLCFF